MRASGKTRRAGASLADLHAGFAHERCGVCRKCARCGSLQCGARENTKRRCQEHAGRRR